jgi:hypothetical protein
MLANDTRAPRHPSLSRRSLVLWRGYRTGIAPTDLERGASGCLAMAVTHAMLEPDVVAAAHKAGLGVALVAQSWRNQLDPADERRARTFAALPYHRPGRRLVPDERPLAGTPAERYAQQHLEAELGAGASIATTPGHVLEREGAAGRAGELLLARLCAEEFALRGGAVPAPDSERPQRRELYATIMLRGSHAVQPLLVDWLARAYAGLEGISGYWIVAVNCTGSRRQLEGFTSLALQLQAASERPAVCAGVGHCHLAMLASGVAASCAGLHGMSFRYPPQALPEPPEDPEEEPTGLGVHVYHSAALGNVGKLGKEGEAARKAAFVNHPCTCGHHPAQAPPRGRTATVAHNCACEAHDALSVIEPAVAEAQAHLSARAEAAERLRAFLHVGKLKRGFYGPAAAAEALQIGRSRAGEQRS